MRTFSLLALLTIASLFSFTWLSAQCIPQMNISVYSDGDVSDDGSTVYGYSSSVDSSTLCSCYHSNYLSASWLVLPDGSYVEGWQPGDTSSVSTPTDGVEGSYYATGAESLDCSCYGNFGVAGPGFPILPPPPNITGIVDTLNWSNTLYQGASGYLAIYGTALTAWGETLSPTVTGDSGVAVSFYWASDTQVNVSYTVSASAAAGSHTLLLQTARGTAQGQVQVAAPCGDQRDAMIAEYVSYSVDLLPTCSSFTQSSPTANFTFAVLNSGTYSWAILTGYLGSGLDGIFAHEPYSMVITSGYRNPVKAYAVNPSSAKTSRHEHGDAVDIATYSNNTQWTAMHNAAKQWGTPGGTPCIEPITGSTNNHLHVDWRPLAMCPTLWLQ